VSLYKAREEEEAQQGHAEKHDRADDELRASDASRLWMPGDEHRACHQDRAKDKEDDEPHETPSLTRRASATVCGSKQSSTMMGPLRHDL
jgi:hypothetical protein